MAHVAAGALGRVTSEAGSDDVQGAGSLGHRGPRSGTWGGGVKGTQRRVPCRGHISSLEVTNICFKMIVFPPAPSHESPDAFLFPMGLGQPFSPNSLICAPLHETDGGRANFCLSLSRDRGTPWKRRFLQILGDDDVAFAYTAKIK